MTLKTIAALVAALAFLGQPSPAVLPTPPAVVRITSNVWRPIS